MADLLLKWLSVEANPEVMTKLARQLGLVSGWEFKDVLGLDGHVLADEPISACGLLFVYPSKYEGHRLAQGSAEDPQGLLFVKYPSRGAGATLALIHTLANADVTLDPGSSLDRFLCAAKALTPSERGSLLETDKDIQAAHETCAKQGQSQDASHVCRDIISQQPDDIRFSAVALCKN
uniref:Ubiquitin carboxyl-terminal hydrolase n=1 Tax=Eptatretus burgeri TaxID=7764 RepID=A0A8C4Q3K7_EPTBU